MNQGWEGQDWEANIDGFEFEFVKVCDLSWSQKTLLRKI